MYSLPKLRVQALGRVPLSERAAAQVVSGHLHYGIHEYIPCECDYIAVLREPVARVVSAYIHILGHPKHVLHAELGRSSEPLETFLRIDPTVDNHQTRMLAGRGGAELTAKSPEPLAPRRSRRRSETSSGSSSSASPSASTRRSSCSGARWAGGCPTT